MRTSIPTQIQTLLQRLRQCVCGSNHENHPRRPTRKLQKRRPPPSRRLEKLSASAADQHAHPVEQQEGWTPQKEYEDRFEAHTTSRPPAPEQQEQQEDGSDAYLTSLPPPPKEIPAHREEVVGEFQQQICRVWMDEEIDSPLKCLYRLYVAFVVDDEIWYRDELEHFWKQHRWAVCDIPDPEDHDPARYAFLACIPSLLIDSFNTKIRTGQARDMPDILTLEDIEYYQTRPESARVYETLPEWAKRVAVLPQTLVIPNHDDVMLEDLRDERAAPAFRSKNILIFEPYIHFT